MDCSEAREHLSDFHRGRLDAGTAEAVRVHVGQCPMCAAALAVEARLRALIQGRAPRYTAPPDLRSRIQAVLAGSAQQQPSVSPEESVTRGAASGARRTGGWSRWGEWLRGHRFAVGSVAGAIALLLVVWAGSLWMARDPVSRLASRAVAEHVEYVKTTMNRPAADPLAVMRDVTRGVGFPLKAVFPGDSQLQLVAGMVSELGGKQAATFVYRDASARYTTLFLMPEAGTTIPAEDRMPIETFKPYHRVTSGRHLLLWKQENLACLLVSDSDERGMVSVFLKIRKAA
jgi:anti-sigma factor (TIGR02949 family)